MFPASTEPNRILLIHNSYFASGRVRCFHDGATHKASPIHAARPRDLAIQAQQWMACYTMVVALLTAKRDTSPARRKLRRRYPPKWMKEASAIVIPGLTPKWYRRASYAVVTFR